MSACPGWACDAVDGLVLILPVPLLCDRGSVQVERAAVSSLLHSS